MSCKTVTPSNTSTTNHSKKRNDDKRSKKKTALETRGSTNPPINSCSAATHRDNNHIDNQTIHVAVSKSNTGLDNIIKSFFYNQDISRQLINK
jgi:hypothetical protein